MFSIILYLNNISRGYNKIQGKNKALTSLQKIILLYYKNSFYTISVKVIFILKKFLLIDILH